VNDIDLNKKLLEACESCVSDTPEENHTYRKHFNTKSGSVTVDASSDSIDELKMLLQKVGITLPGGGPVGHDHEHSPCDDSEEPMQVVSVDVDDEQEEPANPYNSGTPDKQVLTNIIRDKLKAYLMNGSK
jgi:hypothetical protein